MNRVPVFSFIAILFSLVTFSGCGGGGEPTPPPPPTATLVSITVSPTERSIAPETTTQFNATGRFSNGSSRNINSQVRWQSDTAIANISITGLATGVSEGQTSIIAVDRATGISSADSGGNSVLTVSPVVSIAVSPPSATIGEVGMSQQFVATAALEDGNSQDLTLFAVWGSTTSAATISSTGLAIPQAPGTTLIDASFSGVTSGTATLEVVALSSIAITPTNPLIPLGMSQQFIATGGFLPDLPDQVIITNSVTWTSVDVNVATFNPTDDPLGLATSVVAGTTRIEASFNGVLGSTTLFIEALTAVLVSPADRSIFVDGTQQFTATGTLSGGSNIDLTSFVSWDSSNTGVATINNAGLASAVSTGVTTITATADFTGTQPFPSGTTTVTVSLRSGTVEPIYATNGADWNDYVDNNRASVFGATGVACNPVTDGPGYRGCLHGGEMRMVEVSGKTSCTGLSAIDDLGAFDWFCDSSTSPVRMVSAALRERINLSDLIDFSVDPPVFKNNSVTVSDAGGPYLQTPAAVWWANTVVKNNTGGTLIGAGQIYVLTNNTVLGGFTIGADKVALVMAPGTTLADSISASGHDFLWIEGRINATVENAGISLTNSSFSVIRHVRVSNSDTGTDMAGILLDGSSKNLLVDILSANNDNYGLFLVNSSDNNSIWNFVSSNNGVDGVRLSGASGNSLVRITVFNNGTSSAGVGVRLADGSIDNTLFNVTAANNQVHGVAIENLSSNNLLSNVTTVNNGFSSLNGDGFFIGSSSDGMTVQNLTSANNSVAGVHISASASNIFTGILQVGENGFSQDCKLTNSFVHPGVVDVSCTSTGSDGSNFYTGSPDSDAIFFSSFVDLTSSFAAKVTSNDSINTSDDSNGRANIVPSLDWTGFENAFRGWGRDGAAFPIFDNRGRCTLAVDPCRIWDWSINSTDQIILAVNSLPTGNSTITHAFTGSSPTFLRNAAEIMADGFGDDDGLCESGEKCLFTPNMGSYQGDGPLTSAGNITSGTVSGVTLKKRSSNGI